MKSITQLGTLAGIVVVIGILAMLGGLYQVFATSPVAGLMGIAAGFSCLVTGYALDALFSCEAKLTRLVELLETDKRKATAGTATANGLGVKSKWMA